MLREPIGARRYTEPVTLTKSTVSVDDYGHKSIGATADVLEVRAMVRQMSATKTMLTFQQADVIGLEIEFRSVCLAYDGIRWRGHNVNFSHPENEDMRGRITKITGWYQIDNPA